MQVDRAVLWGLCDYGGETTRDKLPIVLNSHFCYNDYTPVVVLEVRMFL